MKTQKSYLSIQSLAGLSGLIALTIGAIYSPAIQSSNSQKNREESSLTSEKILNLSETPQPLSEKSWRSMSPAADAIQNMNLLYRK